MEYALTSFNCLVVLLISAFYKCYHAMSHKITTVVSTQHFTSLGRYTCFGALGQSQRSLCGKYLRIIGNRIFVPVWLPLPSKWISEIWRQQKNLSPRISRYLNLKGLCLFILTLREGGSLKNVKAFLIECLAGKFYQTTCTDRSLMGRLVPTPTRRNCM
jgi:hypothetical protein